MSYFGFGGANLDEDDGRRGVRRSSDDDEFLNNLYNDDEPHTFGKDI